MAYDSLLVCPKNLKECIDWVLRATGMDNGSNNNDIEKLKSALNAELESFNVNSIDLTQLVHGLCLFMGYPSCLCKPKKSVEDSLRKISGELRKDLQNYECLQSNSKPSLNCNSSCLNSDVVCKCCVLDCISKVQTSGCKCVKDSKNNCNCSKDETQRCCKDLLEKLKASLSLLNLKADMEKLCQCPENCCENGVCTQGSSKCPVCINLKTLKDYTVTGLGLLRPSPKRLAEKLEGYFGNGSSKSSSVCTCKCGSPPGSSSNISCCCLACQNCSSQHCSCKGSSGCSCAQALKLQPSQGCPRKKFCEAINSIKIPAESTDMTCCKSGAQCHCELDSNCTASSSSGQKCCIEKDSKNNYKHSIKCLLRRVVKFFSNLSLDPKSSKSDRSRICCELVCVVKTCYFIRDFYYKNGQTFKNALQELQYSGPCGHELYRLIDDFLKGCVFPVAGLNDKDVAKKAVQTAQKSCSACQKASTGKSSSSCDCCSSGTSSCPACTSLLTDPSLKSLFHPEYVSSYDSKASWTSLTSSTPGSKCCGSLSPSCGCQSNCSSGSLCSNPSQCCPDCPQRKAAKIFLGFLPCMYWGLKILYDRCKDPVTWPTWSQKNGQKNLVPASILHAPDLKKFLEACGFTDKDLNTSLQAMVLPGLLENLFSSESSGNFDKIYKEVSEKYFSKHVSDPSKSPPSTVREILLWLSGLPFSKGFKALLQHCKGLCEPVSSLNFNDFESSLYASCLRSPFVLAAIQWPSKSEIFPSDSSINSDSLYPSDPSDLLDMLFENVRKVFVPLKFLSIQCNLDPTLAGWRDCYFGKSCTTTGKFSSSCCSTSAPNGYLCDASGHKKHCDEDGKGCINTDSAAGSGSGNCSKNHIINSKPANCKPCPHPLQRFLTATSDSDSQSQSPSSPFRLPSSFARIDFSQSPPAILDATSDKFLTMGFKTEQLPSPGRSGLSLHGVLKDFCDSKTSPLTRLLKSLVCISRYPPENLFDLYAFFAKFKDSSVFKNDFASYASGEPGTPDGQKLKGALEKFVDSHSPHSNDLRSLYDCEGPRGSSPPHPTCGKYLYPLAQDASDLFVDNFVDTYLSWVCHLTKDFKTLLKELQGKFSSCCQSSSCKKIVECPCAHPLMYSYGFTFWSPKNLNCESHEKHSTGQNQNCTMKSCNDFIEQLGKVVKENSPLQDLLNAIDAFLWSIRLPFFLFVLAFWAFVISYFLYVQLYKLDLLHLKSHAHLSRSFKILPSTLFSDASSKLKDLSYFTL